MEGLKRKIIISFSVLCIIFFVATVTIFIQVNKATESSRRIQNFLAPSIQANLTMINAINRSQSSLQSWILIKDDIFIRQGKAAWSIIDKAFKRLSNYSNLSGDPENIHRLQLVEEHLSSLKHCQVMVENQARKDDKNGDVLIQLQNCIEIVSDVSAVLKRISYPQNWEMERVFNKEERLERDLKNSAICFLILCLIACGGIGILLARVVIVPLNRTVSLAESIANGNYSWNDARFDQNDKLSNSLKVMTEKLNMRELESKSQKEKLEAYNRNLETSNEELSQFAYRTSHDLKAPLITVRGLAGAIEEDIKDKDYDEVEKNAGKIKKHVGKLEDLVIGILNLARSDVKLAGDEDLDIDGIVSDIRMRLESVYISYNVEVISEIDSEVRFFTSKVRVTQILENLVSNGVKYSDRNKNERFVKVITKSEADHNVILVEDNGIGIPKEFEAEVFGMFKRFHPELSYGSGLGMYIVKKHVDKMGGHIEFVSSPAGTQFLIKLPQGV